ncbi:hypothetical protein CRYUN_Cryun27aG0050500 [Craigia yunnanensis]
MNNMHTTLTSIGLVSTRVTTIVSTKVLAISNHPSAGAFSKEALVTMYDIAAFLSRTGTPLMLNVYPLLMPLILNTFHLTLEKIIAANVSIAIAGTGWPSDGKKPYANKENAQIYKSNLHFNIVRRGTPRRPQLMDTFIFLMFDDNQNKPVEQQNFGFFYPNMQNLITLNMIRQ